MGLWRQMVETIGESVSKSKEVRMREKEYVQNNKGTEAICAFIANLFAKGNMGYRWVKENYVGLGNPFRNETEGY